MNTPQFVINPGWVNAPGFLGFAPPAVWPLPVMPIAFVTNPISYSHRRPTPARFCYPIPGGLLLHTGWPNPGFRKAMHHYAKRWSESRVPVWVHLLAEHPEELNRMVRSLEETSGVEAVQISLPYGATDSTKLDLIKAGIGELPLILHVSFNQWEQPWITKAISQGVSAVSLGAPRGVVYRDQHLIQGRLFGPGLLPQGLHALQEWHNGNVPLIGGIGIYDWAGYDATLACGAAAVQLDTVLWRGWEDSRLHS